MHCIYKIRWWKAAGGEGCSRDRQVFVVCALLPFSCTAACAYCVCVCAAVLSVLIKCIIICSTPRQAVENSRIMGRGIIFPQQLICCVLRSSGSLRVHSIGRAAVLFAFARAVDLCRTSTHKHTQVAHACSNSKSRSSCRFLPLPPRSKGLSLPYGVKLCNQSGCGGALARVPSSDEKLTTH